MLAIAGCHKHSEQPQPLSQDAARAKMRLVVDEVIRQTQDQAEKESFKVGEIFVDPGEDGKKLGLIGVSVPDGKSKIHVSFMPAYFVAHDVETVAKEALRNYRNVQQTENH